MFQLLIKLLPNVEKQPGLLVIYTASLIPFYSKKLYTIKSKLKTIYYTVIILVLTFVIIYKFYLKSIQYLFIYLNKLRGQ